MRTRSIREGPQTAHYPEDLDRVLDEVEQSVTEAEVSEPTEEQIARRANQIWRLKGCPDGTAEEDWFEAVEQLRDFYR